LADTGSSAAAVLSMPAQAQRDLEDLCRRLRRRQVGHLVICMALLLCKALCVLMMVLHHAQVEGPLSCAKATAELMRTVVTRRGHPTPQALLSELTAFGVQLQAAKPLGASRTSRTYLLGVWSAREFSKGHLWC